VRQIKIAEEGERAEQTEPERRVRMWMQADREISNPRAWMARMNAEPPSTEGPCTTPETSPSVKTTTKPEPALAPPLSPPSITPPSRPARVSREDDQKRRSAKKALLDRFERGWTKIRPRPPGLRKVRKVLSMN
jgi:hypothetical protein